MTETKTHEAVEHYIWRHHDRIDAGSRAALQGLTLWDYQVIHEAARYVSYGAPTLPGISCKLIRTDKSAGYFMDANEQCYRPGERIEMTPLGAIAWLYRCMQVRKGGPMESIVVVDFVDYRMVLAQMIQTKTKTGIEGYLWQYRNDMRNECSRAAIAELTDEQFDAVFEAARHVSYGTLVRPGVTCSVVKSYKTLGDYDNLNAGRWCCPGERTEMTFGEYPAVMYSYAQMYVGGRLHNILVIDLGEYRVVLM